MHPVDASAQPALDCRDINRSFRHRDGILAPYREIKVVRNVNLSVAHGQTLGIVGESGSGKTTLARMILGLMEPTSGEILLDGKPIGRKHIRENSRKVQPVFQDPYSSLNPRKTIQSIVEWPLRVHAIGDRQERRRRVSEMLGLVGLPQRLIHSYPNQLSGGQRQRVAIARALITRPSVLICDEPTSALDVSVQAHILNLLLHLAGELHLTYVLISHNLPVIEHMSDWVAVMYLGEIVEYGPTEEIFREPRHPYTRMLFDSVLSPRLKSPPQRRVVQESTSEPGSASGCRFHARCPSRMEVCARSSPEVIEQGRRRVSCHLYGPAGQNVA